MASRAKALITASRIEQSILLLRGHRVLLDSTLAGLYGVRPRFSFRLLNETGNGSLRISCLSLTNRKLQT